MALMAKLKVVLHANNTVVAESEDPTLWQKVFATLNGQSSSEVFGEGDKEKGSDGGGGFTSDSAVGKLAAELGVDEKMVKGACAPIAESPFIHLDKHHWEALKKNTGARGRAAVPSIVLAATLLVLWKDVSKLGATKLEESHDVLKTIHESAKNAARSIRNCEWLQTRHGAIVLNPAKTSSAIALARAYCLKKPIKDAQPSND